MSMTRKPTRKCLVCGKEFVPCASCAGDELLSWRRVVCCAEHFSFHLAMVEYSRGAISASQALEDIRECEELYGKPDYCGSAKKQIDEITRRALR